MLLLETPHVLMLSIHCWLCFSVCHDNCT